MRILISPAKKMIVDTDGLDVGALPCFLPRTERLLARLREMSYEELKALWRCSDRIALPAARQLARVDLRRGLTPALLAYEGLQYRRMAPGVFTDEELGYVQTHLRILSGFYGLLRPFDGVVPYRLEMQARLAVDGSRDLYAFWGGMPAAWLFRETDTVLDLASREYSRCVTAHRPAGARIVTCVFGELQSGRVVEKGTLCKMARGEMVRYLAVQRAAGPEQAKEFALLGYRYCAERSAQDLYTFLRE